VSSKPCGTLKFPNPAIVNAEDHVDIMASLVRHRSDDDTDFLFLMTSKVFELNSALVSNFSQSFRVNADFHPESWYKTGRAVGNMLGRPSCLMVNRRRVGNFGKIVRVA